MLLFPELFTKSSFTKTLTLLALMASSGFSLSASSETLLQILPTRVVLDKERSTTITLINRGNEDSSFRLFFRNIRQNSDGGFTEISEDDEVLEGELFSESLVRFSPRRVIVPGRSKQQVRIVVRKPKDLAEGEYRSHLVFRKLPKQESVLNETKENQVSLSFKPIVEVTIPIIVRHGNLNAETSLSDLTLVNDEDEGTLVEVQISRSGNRSLYGDMDIWWQPNDGEEQRVAFAKGVAVYIPASNRTLQVGVSPDTAITGKGTLRAVFNEDPAYGGDLKAEITTAR